MSWSPSFKLLPFPALSRFNACDVPFAFAGLGLSADCASRWICFHRLDGFDCQFGGYISSNFALSALVSGANPLLGSSSHRAVPPHISDAASSL